MTRLHVRTLILALVCIILGALLVLAGLWLWAVLEGGSLLITLLTY